MILNSTRLRSSSTRDLMPTSETTDVRIVGDMSEKNKRLSFDMSGRYAVHLDRKEIYLRLLDYHKLLEKQYDMRQKKIVEKQKSMEERSPPPVKSSVAVETEKQLVQSQHRQAYDRLGKGFTRCLCGRKMYPSLNRSKTENDITVAKETTPTRCHHVSLNEEMLGNQKQDKVRIKPRPFSSGDIHTESSLRHLAAKEKAERRREKLRSLEQDCVLASRLIRESSKYPAKRSNAT